MIRQEPASNVQVVTGLVNIFCYAYAKLATKVKPRGKTNASFMQLDFFSTALSESTAPDADGSF